MKSSSKNVHDAMDSNEPPAKKKLIKFRNYTPKDDELKIKRVEKTKPLDVTEDISEHLQKGKPEKLFEEVDLATLAPRKPDWDLKRDLQKKLEKLEKKTQKAIVELIRERLQSGDDDLATAVNAVTDR